MVYFSILTAATASFISVVLAAPMVAETGPTISAAATNKIIQGSYIVTLKDNIQPSTMEAHMEWVDVVHKRSLKKRDTTGVKQTYTGSFQGYAGNFDEDMLEQIRANPDVAVVEEDKMWRLAYIDNGKPAQANALSKTHASNNEITKRSLVNQKNAPHGLGTVSHRKSDTWEYIHDPSGGQDTYAYVVDTGVLPTHDEFRGRAQSAYTAFPDQPNDNHGHGTHVSATIAGREFGVAKKANILAVKVFEGKDSPTSTILGGYNWAVNDIIEKKRQNCSIINMSLEGASSAAYNTAVEKAYKAGVLSIMAAGNGAQNASNFSPASSPYAFTVGAVDRDWIFASDYSNYGKDLAIFGPGTDVLSAWNDGDFASRVISGTSMAAPHISGLALYAMTVQGVRGNKAVSDYLLATATKGAVTGKLMGSPNLLGNNNNTMQKKAK